VGRSKLRTHETETKSIPREIPYSLSCFEEEAAALRARLEGWVVEGGGEGERGRLLEVEVEASASLSEVGSGEVAERGAAGWVEMTVRERWEER